MLIDLFSLADIDGRLSSFDCIIASWNLLKVEFMSFMGSSFMSFIRMSANLISSCLISY
jgi:hypothetical protein